MTDYRAPRSDEPTREPRVLVGDCLLVMPTLAPESVDAIVTDPPYHLTTGKKSGSGPASTNLESPYGRARIGTGFMGKAWDGGDVAFRVETWAAALRVVKPGAHLVAFGGTRTFHRLTCAIEDAGWEIRDCLSWLYGSGFPKSHNGAWGGTALKPAWEPIILARKPLIGTVAANVQAHGTGGLNIDGCRIGFESEGDRASAFPGGRTTSHGAGSLAGPGTAQNAKRSDFATERNAAGRWPANVCLDEDAARLLDEQAPETGAFAPVRGTEPSRPAKNTYGEYARGGGAFHHDGLQGASRFFYTSKASRAERNAGVEHLAAKPLNWSSGAQSPGTFQAEGTNRTAANHHPTVKPLDLMQWLCRLVTPKGGLVLDPFCGSGSTGRAAVAEGFRFIGIELSEEYAAIARARIAEYAPLFGDVA